MHLSLTNLALFAAISQNASGSANSLSFHPRHSSQNMLALDVPSVVLKNRCSIFHYILACCTSVSSTITPVTASTPSLYERIPIGPASVLCMPRSKYSVQFSLRGQNRYFVTFCAVRGQRESSASLNFPEFTQKFHGQNVSPTQVIPWPA